MGLPVLVVYNNTYRISCILWSILGHFWAKVNTALTTINNFIVQFQKKYILPPQKGLEFPGGGGSVRPQNLKKHMKLNWNFQRGKGVLVKIPSVGVVWIFNYTFQFEKVKL